MFEAALLGTTNNILCSNLNISCSTDLKETLESKISPEEFVWFEDGRRNVEDDLLEEKYQKANKLCPGLNEFVWFQDGEKTAILSNKIIDSVEKVLESNTNLII
jgi:hypothetical protein